jgi:ubiquinone/menaquinone biosynthesis C-methylase UbiE
MKGRESGMPPEDRWASFYNAECVVRKLMARSSGHVAEFGAGYGTFTIPASRLAAGTVFAFDIENELVSLVSQKAREAQCLNVRSVARDFVEQGTGLPNASVDHAMLYNILHIEGPKTLLREAYRILRPGASISVIHWRSDLKTPRGPSLEIRPAPAQCAQWVKETGFAPVEHVDLPCCPYHFGLVGIRP